jgi:putative hydrolase of the HAD superfamily
MFDLALERARVEHHSVVHVGDEPFYDVEAAHRSSIASIWMNRSGSPWPDGYRPAHAEVNSMIQVRPAIDRIMEMRSKPTGMR